jgi:ubiquinone biosynthesis protein COQ9
MNRERTEMTQETKDRILDSALSHVPFDGWSEATFKAAVADTAVPFQEARALFPRGAADLAAAYHRRGDDQMLARMASEDLTALRYSEKVAAAVRFRLEATADKEILRRGVTFYSMPQHAPEGSALVWGTVDKIWTALGDTSDDINWYSKRAILAGVYGSTLLYWLGDDSDGHSATWAFLDRRIGDVMQFEKLKASVRDNAALKPFVGMAESLLGGIRAPKRDRTDLPGRWPGR